MSTLKKLGLALIGVGLVTLGVSRTAQAAPTAEAELASGFAVAWSRLTPLLPQGRACFLGERREPRLRSRGSRRVVDLNRPPLPRRQALDAMLAYRHPHQP